MNCANCGKEIYWNHNVLLWRHVEIPYGDCELQSAEPKIDDELRKVYCEHCGWLHILGEIKPEGCTDAHFVQISGKQWETIICQSCGKRMKIDESKTGICKHCGVEIHFDEYSQRWGHFFEGDIHKDQLYEYCFADLNPKYKAEPEHDLIILDEVKALPTDCIKCDQIGYIGGPSYADKGLCNLGANPFGDKLLFHFVFGVRPGFHIPPTWCPLKVKESEKTYPIELKRRSLIGSLGFLFDSYDRGKLDARVLIDMIRTRFGSEPIEHPNVTGFEKCRTCGGKGRIRNSEIIALEVPCPKCNGTGIQEEG